MKKSMAGLAMCAALCVAVADVQGRGFGGGFRAGGASFGGASFGGGYRAGGESYGGYRAGGVGGYNVGGVGGSYSSYRQGGAYEGWRGGGVAGGSYDRNWTGDRGGSVNVSGDRGVAVGPRGGVAAGGSRDVTATGPGGRTYSNDRQAGVAVGPYGRTVGGASGSSSYAGPRGAADADWQSAFAGNRFATDFGMGHYSSFNVAAGGHSTSYWSRGYMTNRATNIRSSFGYYNCFRPGWYGRYPGAWYAAGWTAGAAAWVGASYASLVPFCSYPATPIDYDYGSTVVYQNNDVYVNGQQTATAEQYSQQATALADQGAQANAPPDQEWKALGVFALVQGEETTSNNIFQLAVNKDGIIRGNYYDGLMDTTTPIYGSVDAKSQRAAWTIGKKNDRVFEAGIYNLTQSEAPVLVHVGDTSTQQWLLVRVQQPSNQLASPYSAVQDQ